MSGSWEATVGAVRVVFGAGRLAELAAEAAALGGRRAFLVTDRGVRAAGHAERAADAMATADLDVELWDGTEENPSETGVATAAQAARRHEPDLLVAVGGGSAMDTAKGVAFLLAGGGRMRDYQGSGTARGELLPAIAAPTTAGTGSEAQSYALVSRDDDHRKMACGDPGARFRTVILDPDLTATVPFRVAATAGLDALSHAVESHVSTAANPVSRVLSREAWCLLEASLGTTLADPGDAEARAAVLLGAHLAGAAIEQSMLGAAHACANPLTARHGLPHGQAVALMLPAVVRFNAEVAGARYGELAAAAGLGQGEPGELVAARVAALREAGGLPGRLQAVGVARAELAERAAEAAEQWTGRFNPRPVGVAELLELYRSAW